MSSFWNFLDRRVKFIEKGTPWFVNNKIKLHEWLMTYGYPTPNIYAIHDHSNIDKLFSNEFNEFVIKPNLMHSTGGVYPVRKINDMYFDILRHNFIDKAHIIKNYEQIYEKHKFKESLLFFTEEIFLTQNNRILPDYKFYTFSNGVGFILRIDRNSSHEYFTIYDSELNILNVSDIMDKDWVQDSHFQYAMATPDAIVKNFCSTAVQIVHTIKTPFMSIDCYSTKHGVIIGEMTPAPGGVYYKKFINFNKNFDNYLGSLL